MDKDFDVEFKQCPNCGSTIRFCEELGKELVDRGLARPEWQFNMDVRTGVVMDKTQQSKLLMCASLPGFHILTDICMDCGTIYATRLIRLEGGVKPAPPLPKPRPTNIFRNNPGTS